MIDIFNFIFGRVFDAGFYLFQDLNSWIAMVAISLLTALLMLLVYRVVSNQERIRAVKNKVIAHLLEVRLYKDSLPTSFRAQGMILWYNLKYLGHSAPPMLVMLVPLVLTIIQLDLWFGYESLKPSESAIVKVRLKEGSQASRENIAVESSPGFVIETPPLRIDSESEVDWRLRATEPGSWDMMIVANDQAVAKRIIVGTKSLSKISPARVTRNWINQLINPGEPAISESSAVKMIEIGYAPRRMCVFGWRLHWLIVYFGLSVVFGFALKGLFKVEI